MYKWKGKNREKRKRKKPPVEKDQKNVESTQQSEQDNKGKSEKYFPGRKKEGSLGRKDVCKGKRGGAKKKDSYVYLRQYSRGKERRRVSQKREKKEGEVDNNENNERGGKGEINT